MIDRGVFAFGHSTIWVCSATCGSKPDYGVLAVGLEEECVANRLCAGSFLKPCTQEQGWETPAIRVLSGGADARDCRQIHLTREFFSNTFTLITLTLWLKVSRRAHSLHPHAIHDVTCLSVRWLFPCFVFFLCLSRLYLLSTVHLFSILHIIFHNVESAED